MHAKIVSDESIWPLLCIWNLSVVQFDSLFSSRKLRHQFTNRYFHVGAKNSSYVRGRNGIRRQWCRRLQKNNIWASQIQSSKLFFWLWKKETRMKNPFFCSKEFFDCSSKCINHMWSKYRFCKPRRKWNFRNVWQPSEINKNPWLCT